MSLEFSRSGCRAGPEPTALTTVPTLATAHRFAHTLAQDSAHGLPDPQPQSAWLVSWYVHIGPVAQIPSPSQTIRLQAYCPGSTSPPHLPRTRPATRRALDTLPVEKFSKI